MPPNPKEKYFYLRPEKVKNKHIYLRARLKTFFYDLLYLKVEKRLFIFTIVLLLFILGGLYASAYSDLYKIYEIYIINQEGRVENIKPNETVSIKFSRPIKKEAEKFFSIEPEIPGKVIWQDNSGFNYAKTFVFKPNDYFEPDTLYKIKFAKIESFYGTQKKNLTYIFHTINSPKIKAISPGQVTNVSLNPKFEIFLDRRLDSYFYFKFSLNHKTEVVVDFQDDKNKFIVRPKTQLGQNLTYNLNIEKYFTPELNSNLTTAKLLTKTQYTFTTVPPIEITKTEPANGNKKVETYQDIKISFNRQVNYETAEKNFSIEPKTEGNFGWEENTLIFEPTKLIPNTDYQVKIAPGVKAYEDDGFLENEYTLNFKTRINPTEAIPNVPIEPVITEGKYIDIDISEQILTMFEDGKNLGSYLVSTGKYGMPTPLGEFKILNKSKLAYSNKYNLYMPYWMAFTTAGHGIHELPFWKYRGGREYKEREAHLGHRISHGCVRLGVGPAERVYNWAEIGTPVVVHE